MSDRQQRLFPSPQNAAGRTLSADHSSCAVGGLWSPRPTPVAEPLQALKNMEHRGSGVMDDQGRMSGDGCGILARMPALVSTWLARLDPSRRFPSDPFEALGVGTLFLPQNPEEAACVEEMATMRLQALDLNPLGWRTVPVDPAKAGLGIGARETMPLVRQLFVERPEGMSADAFEARLFTARRELESSPAAQACYVAGLSSRVLGYKGMLDSRQFDLFFRDFHDAEHPFESACYVLHRRFSTNTWPDWKLAQPFRWLAHNGEINSLAANRDAVHDLEERRERPSDAGDILMAGGSDSSDLDRVVERHHRRGHGLGLVLMALIPPAWRAEPERWPERAVRFFQYHKFRLGSLGQWEGPAGVVATDGRRLLAKEDRIGLRPLRWSRLADGTILAASEAGAFPAEARGVVQTGKLGSGQIMQVDEKGDLLFDAEVLERELADNPELARSMERFAVASPALPPPSLEAARALDKAGDGAGDEAGDKAADEALDGLNRRCFFTRQHRQAVAHMLTAGAEPTGAMGKPAPAAGISDRPESIYDFFHQQFAQITNPPIDFIREKKFFSLHMFLGDRAADQALELPGPLLDPEEMAFLEGHPAADVISIGFRPGEDPASSAAACRDRLTALLAQVALAIGQGKSLFILTDGDPRPNHEPIPGPILSAFLHHGLIRAGVRRRCALILKARDMREPHDMAVNLAFGVNAVHPLLVWENAVRESERVTRESGLSGAHQAANLKSGLNKALLKIMAKMGVTTPAGYRNAQLFMPFGLGEDVLSLIGKADLYGLGGRTLGEILQFPRLRQESPKPQELRVWDSAVELIQQAALGGRASFLKKLEKNRPVPFKILHLLDFRPPTGPASRCLEEPRELAARYFIGAAMSHGALKDAPHRAVAGAFNGLGGLSNSGEGGEDRQRDGGPFNSRIRQVASGRFGVEARYLFHADELQIKIAQGAKPGEGGQLMGVKVDAVIAKNRHCAPGTTLISPQTHQDIYSIEDLRQLIHDLKSLNPRARASVKIAAEFGVGVIAVGAAKMFADIIEIDSMDGGTGATPVSSRDHAAHYAELGLLEAHRALLASGLRPFVRLRAAGGIKTGADVVKYAALGADEFALGTPLLVAMGCSACAQCHTGACPTEIAGIPKKQTAIPELSVRQERVENYLLALARDVVRILEALGLERLAEATGRMDLLQAKTFADSSPLSRINLDYLFKEGAQPVPAVPDHPNAPFQILRRREVKTGLNRQVFDELEQTILRGADREIAVELGCGDRSFGAMIAGEIVRRWPLGYPHGRLIRLRARGFAGQKLGFGCVAGMAIDFEGIANDGPGAAMSGGLLVIRPPAGKVPPEEQAAAGNAVGYGALGGEIDILGRVGERCAIRNSGASIVVGGANDFLAEYQTGGETISLSPPGQEAGAGMTGGALILYDSGTEHPSGGGRLLERLADGVAPFPPGEADFERLQQRLIRFHQRTQGVRIGEILAGWFQQKERFLFFGPAKPAA